jgi:hypothetical protein
MWIRTILGTVVIAACCAAQNPSEPAKAPTPAPEEQKFFHLEFVVKELDSGKTVNSRSYSMNVATGNEGTQIRSGNKVYVENSYLDFGTNIDCGNVREAGGMLSFHILADVSNAVSDVNPSGKPLIRQVRWNSPVLIALRKPTVIFSADDSASTHQLQLEVTASLLK